MSRQPATSVTDRRLTVMVTRRARPGREGEFEAWLERVAEVARSFSGHQGVRIYRPQEAGGTDYVILYSYDTVEHLQAWERSERRAQLIAESTDLAAEPPHEAHLSGLETWFTLPGRQLVLPPPKWKMWLVSTLAIYPLINLISLGAAPWLARLPPSVRLLAVIPVMGAVMTWIVMPQLTRLLRPWLQAR